MAAYCITYELKYNLKHYDKFFEAIKSFASWYKQSANIWFITTIENYDAIVLRDHLYKFMYKDDKLFVIKVEGNWAGSGHAQNEYDWLKSNLG
jgi:hypothetical protein